MLTDIEYIKTRPFVFVEAPLQEVEEAYRPWVFDIAETWSISTRHAATFERQCLSGVLSTYDRATLGFGTSPEASVLFEPRPGWTAHIDNAPGSGSADAFLGVMCERLHARGLFVYDQDFPTGSVGPAYQVNIFGNRGESLDYIHRGRDGKHWDLLEPKQGGVIRGMSFGLSAKKLDSVGVGQIMRGWGLDWQPSLHAEEPVSGVVYETRRPPLKPR